jgi:hypothetical protein
MQAGVHWYRRYESENGQGSQAMKSQRVVALTLPSKPCQRPGRSNLGRRRLQKHRRIIRSLYFRDRCLEPLLAIHINDLFVKFGVTPKEGWPARP